MLAGCVVSPQKAIVDPRSVLIYLSRTTHGRPACSSRLHPIFLTPQLTSPPAPSTIKIFPTTPNSWCPSHSLSKSPISFLTTLGIPDPNPPPQRPQRPLRPRLNKTHQPHNPPPPNKHLPPGLPRHRLFPRVAVPAGQRLPTPPPRRTRARRGGSSHWACTNRPDASDRSTRPPRYTQ